MYINNDLLINILENHGRKLTDEAVIRKLIFKAKRAIVYGEKVTVGFNMATLPVGLDSLSTRVCEELRPYTSIE